MEALGDEGGVRLGDGSAMKETPIRCVPMLEAVGDDEDRDAA